MASGQWPPRGGALRQHVDQGDGSGAWSSQGEGPGAEDDELQVAHRGWNSELSSGGLGTLGVQSGFGLYPEDAETPGGSGAAGSHNPLLPWGSALPMTGCSGHCGLLSVLEAQPGSQQGDWLARGKMLGCFSSLSPCWHHWGLLQLQGLPPTRPARPSSHGCPPKGVACTPALEAPAPLISPAQRGGPFLWSLISGQTPGPRLASRLFYPRYSHPGVTAPLRALECSLHSDGNPSDTHPFLKWD